MSLPEPEVCRQIETERPFGKTRCGVIPGPVTPPEIARAFGLSDDVEIYTIVTSDEAAALATHVLTTSLTYGGKEMSPSRAAELWQRFAALFDEPVQFLTNCRSSDFRQFSPATDATIDLGVLVVGKANGGCLWVEDYD
ncbi:hypothetical protein [Bradyrhizobium sp. Y36]|uniref:hypothetical protein n=1 Tax=Bradyrhizobium sp. Y36 TaxID=2035447 RepID=UPI001178050C|nr:hypothetical protein [Bradyrhizobium sp. Y36]